MQRFKKYIDKYLKSDKVKDSSQLQTFGITCKRAPDPPEEFDEFEFCTDFSGKDVVIAPAVLSGKIKRIMLGFPDAQDPDIVRPLTESQLKEFLDQKGEQLIGFFDYITQ